MYYPLKHLNNTVAAQDRAKAPPPGQTLKVDDTRRRLAARLFICANEAGTPVIPSYCLFHLNLAFSSIPVRDRALVIARCYEPILRLITEKKIPVGVEISAWTLEEVARLAPSWVERLRALIAAGACELIGSGYAQLIGPLVPAEVNVWNQRLGHEVYEKLLGVRPSIALVNEMAFSSSLVDLYLDSGYRAIVLDRENIKLALRRPHQPGVELPNAALGPSGRSIGVLWADPILFQRFQRCVHGEISLEQYVEQLSLRLRDNDRPLPIYTSDAEIFDYRPARFHDEATIHSQEWERLGRLLDTLAARDFAWISPSQAVARLSASSRGPALTFSSASFPIPTKKQLKYNVSRWAITGRNDLWVNTVCHRLQQKISTSPHLREDAGTWRRLCELWASDYRTHIEEERWVDFNKRLLAFGEELGVDLEFRASSPVSLAGPSKSLDELVKAGGEGAFELSLLAENTLLRISSPRVRLTLNLRRGLAIELLSFQSQGHTPVLGTIPQGSFSCIELSADYYSGTTLLELPTERRRLTDLSPVLPEVSLVGSVLTCRAAVQAGELTIYKTVRLDAASEKVLYSTGFASEERPFGTVRVAHMSLLPEAWRAPLQLQVKNGGEAEECHALVGEVRHDLPSTSLVSNRSGMGATSGCIKFTDPEKGLAFRWDPARCAAFPLLIHTPSQPNDLTRLIFSLEELDETSRKGGRLLAFDLEISSLPAQQLSGEGR